MPEIPDIDSKGGRPTRKESQLRESFRILAQEKDAEIERLKTRIAFLELLRAPVEPETEEE